MTTDDDRRRTSPTTDPYVDRLTISLTADLHDRLSWRAGGTNRTLADVAREALTIGLDHLDTTRPTTTTEETTP